ncbi:MRN complex-interacting protein [Papilio machaon]|uniref:MRN complex-interacting protein n=1 Tax=Papilio machaon TaxID=76193 RepID=UPI001E665D47|nr:MRN complex-interacting protein [Papilio machaon]
MPQLFQVLRCYKCLVFQIHQTKKSNKWQCKMCGEKQSIKRHYGIGNGKECRLHVQKLNGLRGEIEDEKLNSLHSNDDYSNSEEENVESNLFQNELKTESKWSTYIEKEEEHQVNEPMYLDNDELCLDIPSKEMKSVKRKKVIPANKENFKKSFKAPYKNESEETPMAFAQKLIEPIKNAVDNKSNMTAVNKLSNPHKAVSSFIQQNFEKNKIQINSKWAQFVEKENDFEENECPPQNSSLTDTTKLFQLCDDTDLDDVLNI